MTAKKPDAVSPSVAALYDAVHVVLEQARASAYRTVNVAMVRAYWQVGCLIFEHEQKGKARAVYGEAMLEELSRRLVAEFGRGFDVTNLRKMRQFYRMFEIRDAVRLASAASTARHAVCDELSWSHYRLLMQVEDPASREWYMHEAVDQHWCYDALKTRRFDPCSRVASCPTTIAAKGGGRERRGNARSPWPWRQNAVTTAILSVPPLHSVKGSLRRIAFSDPPLTLFRGKNQPS